MIENNNNASIRSELEIFNEDEDLEHSKQIIWKCYEKIGVGYVNIKAICALDLPKSWSKQTSDIIKNG